MPGFEGQADSLANVDGDRVEDRAYLSFWTS